MTSRYTQPIMEPHFVLSDYVEQALGEASYDKLDDGTFAGRITSCPGVVAFGDSLRGCEDELRSTLEDWMLLGLKLGHPLPVLGGIDLNRQPVRESVEARAQELIHGLAVSASRPEGTPGKELLRFAGILDEDAAREMEHTIEEGCERVDVNAW